MSVDSAAHAIGPLNLRLLTNCWCAQTHALGEMQTSPLSDDQFSSWLSISHGIGGRIAATGKPYSAKPHYPRVMEARMTILHHLAVLTTDLERARSFYRDAFGLQEIERPPFKIPTTLPDRFMMRQCSISTSSVELSLSERFRGLTGLMNPISVCAISEEL